MAVSLFGVNASLFAQAAAELWTTLTGIALPEWVFTVAGGVLMTAGAALGFQSLKFLSVLLVPVQLLVLLWLVQITLTGTGFAELLHVEPVGGITLGDCGCDSFLCRGLLRLRGCRDGRALVRRERPAAGHDRLAFVFVLFSSWITNAMNLYSCSLSINAVFRNLREWHIAVAAGEGWFTLTSTAAIDSLLVTSLLFWAIEFSLQRH